MSATSPSSSVPPASVSPGSLSQLRLADVSKFALALNSPNRRRSTSRLGGGGGNSAGGVMYASGSQSSMRKQQHQELTRRLRTAAFASSGSLARENASELSAIRSVDELDIDFAQALRIKRGDLAIIQGQTYRCFPKAPHLSDIPLILKRLECMDRRIYDLKVYEADTFMRFQGHANVVSLYSYWSEPAPNSYTYKTLVLLEEEGIGGPLEAKLPPLPGPVASNAPVSPSAGGNPAVGAPKPSPPSGAAKGTSLQLPSYRQALKWCADIAKGLIAFHSCNLIHGRVRPDAIFLDGKNNAMLGMMGRVELDAARQTHQLFSKVLIGAAIPQLLVYWAPELLKLESYDTSIDMWAFGVCLYRMCTGKLPFRSNDENQFRDDVLTANVNIDALADYPRILTVVDNLLLVAPAERWTAHDVLAFVQHEFAIEIQRQFRGFSSKKDYVVSRWKIIKLQAWIRSRLQRMKFMKMRAERREQSARRIQAVFKGYCERKKFRNIRAIFMKCQARLLARQCRESYLQYKQCVVVCQSYARRYITQRWYDRVREGRAVLEAKLRTLSAMAARYRQEAAEFGLMFADGKIPQFMSYLASLETYDRLGDRSALPELHAADARAAEAMEEAEELRLQMQNSVANETASAQEEEQLREDLGCKYAELGPMMDALKRNLRRVAQQCQRAEALPVAIQHPYTYSKWDQVHEPHNVVENVLKDDAQVWKTVSPAVDLTLCREQVCFVAYVTVVAADPAPAAFEVFTSSVPDKWTLLSTFKCDASLPRGAPHRFLMPGEPLCKYLRVVCKNNVRGGNIVSLQRVIVEGLVKDSS